MDTGLQQDGREDDALWEALLGKGKALRELFGGPVVHGGQVRPVLPEASGGCWREGGGREVW